MVNPFLQNYKISSTFEQHKKRKPPSKNPGTDYVMPVGSVIIAPESGTITHGVDGFGGIWLTLLGKTYKWQFIHLSQIKTTMYALEGDIIALSGNTGQSSGPHTHVTIWRGNTRIDPQPIIFNLPFLQNMDNKLTELIKKQRPDVYQTYNGDAAKISKWWDNGGWLEFACMLGAHNRRDVIMELTYKWVNKPIEMKRWYVDWSHQIAGNPWEAPNLISNCDYYIKKLNQINNISKI